MESLRDRLLAVLDDEDASLTPPSAGEMSQEEWDALPERERELYRREQLATIDPRSIPSYTMNAGHPGSRASRAYG